MAKFGLASEAAPAGRAGGCSRPLRQMGRHHGRRGVSRLLMGNVAGGLVRKCTVPVMLIRAMQQA